MFKMEGPDSAGCGCPCQTNATGEQDMDYEGGYGRNLTTVLWNLEDCPIPSTAVLDSIYPRIQKAFALMRLGWTTEIQGYADLDSSQIDRLCAAYIYCTTTMLPAYMPKRMIVHSQSRSRIREQVRLFIIANQRPGSEVHRVQQCLKARKYTVIVLDNLSKGCLFHCAECLLGGAHFLGARHRVSRSICGRAFFSGQEPISKRRWAELLVELKRVVGVGGKYSSEYVQYVSSLCYIIAQFENLSLDYVLDCIRYICPIDDDMIRIIDKVLEERGFVLDFSPAEDDAKESPFSSSSGHSSSLIGGYSSKLVPRPEVLVRPEWLSTCFSHSHSDPISQFDISKIQDFSEPISPVKRALFWDVVDCPFPLGSDPDEIYIRIYKHLSDKGYRGHQMTIWAYVDENGPWSGEYLRNKTWRSRLYFIPGGDKASRLRRMENDSLLWKMDMLSAVRNTYTADVIVLADQVREDTEFLSTLKYMSLDRFNTFLVTPTQHVNKPESLEWPGLLLAEAACIGRARAWENESESELSPKRHKA